MSQNLQNIKDKLYAYKKKYHTIEFLNGLVLTASILLVTFLVVVLMDTFGQFNTTLRTTIFYAFLAIGLYVLVKHIGLPLKKLLNSNTELSDEQASKQIGQFFPEIKDKLLNTIQLTQFDSSDTSLVMASINQRTEILQPFEFNQAVNLKETKSLLIKYLFLPFILFLGLLLFYRDGITDTTKRIINHHTTFEKEAPFRFKVINSDLKAFNGSDFNIKMEIEGENIPETVYLVSPLGKQLIHTEKTLFSHTFYNLQQSLPFHFEAAGFESETFNIEVVEIPELNGISLDIEFPEYLNRKNKKETNLSNLVIPEGTNVTWNISAKHTDSLNFIFNDSIKLEAKRNTEDNYSLTRRFKKDEFYSLLMQNEHGQNTDDNSFQVNVIKDKYPGIELERYSDSVLYSYILVGGTVYDDYGLNSLKLFYRNTSQTSSNEKYISKNIKISSGKPNQNFVYQFDLSELNLLPGDQIDYFLRVWDNDAVNGSKSTKSRLSTFKLPTKKELKEKNSEKSTASKNEISRALSKSDEINNELKKLSDQLKTKKELTWQDKKDVEKMLQKHRQLQSEVENLKDQVQLNNEQKKRFDEIDPETQKKMDQLQKLMEDLIDPETQKLMDELQKLLEDEASMDEINDKLQELENQDDNFEKELDRTLEMYKKLELEQQLKNAINELDELSKKQDELNDKTEKAKDKEELQNLEKEQKDLNNEFKELQKDLDNIEKANDELENKENLDLMKEDQQDISESMEQSSEQMENGKKKNASKSQQNASEKMKQMAQKMKENMEKSGSMQLEENIEDLKNILHNLIQLSFQQEDVMQNLQGLNRKDPLFTKYSQKQIFLERDSKILEDSLYALAKRVFQLESIITKELSVMAGSLNESSLFIKQRDARRAQIKQQKAMTSMNNLALLLDDLLDSMQQQMAEQSDGDQMCNEPGGSKPKSGKGKPGNMGDMQKSINEMIKQLKDGQKQGKSMSKELAKLAARQEMLRRKLGELKGKGGPGTKPGDSDKEGKLAKELDALEKAMKQTEEDLLNKKLSEKTLDRQQDILTRLLEAENASREQELDNKREAESAKTSEVSKPLDYSKYIQLKKQQIELLQTIPPSLNPYYKKEANEYFDNIEY